MYVITIDKEKCEACGDCVDTCPNEILGLVEDGGKMYAMLTGSADDCIGCYSCESTCEQGALTVTEL